MKEQYLTITEMTFLLEGDVLGYGQIIASAPGPERPGELSQSLVQGAIRMGTFLPAGEDVPAGRWEASLPCLLAESPLVYALGVFVLGFAGSAFF